MLFGWGDGSYGQLGSGEEGASQPVPLRRALPAVGGQEVVLVACGERHTLLLLADGSLASCGDNAQGQLGRKLPAGRQRKFRPSRFFPEPIQALEAQTIISISCGKEHSLAISSQGKVFSWGAGGFGQLGTGNLKDSSTPKKIDSLSMYNVIQVACGHYHSIALTKDGRLFSWGQNSHGQLGLGKEVSSQATPCNISSLAGIPLAQVAAGGSHSFVLSHSGVVYGWGRNNVHQLGLSQKTSKEQIFKPYSIGALRNLEVTYISCGDEHTAVLTKSGSVFTFGDDSAGQLGHNSSKTGPQKIDEIDDPVSHISCGSYHTLCVSESGQLWSFGRGLLQQAESSALESRQEERKCIDLNALLAPNELLGVKVFAGAFVNFVNIFQASACANAATSLEVLPRISQLDRGLIEKWKSAEIGSEAQQNAKREIEEIFSSPPCLTASFLQTRSDVSMDCYIPVNLQETREVLNELTEKDWIAEQICSSLLNHLFPALPRSSRHQEALAIFLLVPECCVALGAHRIPSLALQFAEAVTGLSKSSSNILENYWSLLPRPFLEQIVQMLKTYVSSMLPCYNLYPKEKPWIDTLKVLKMLYKVNMKAKSRLQTSTFCIDEITQKINLQEDFWRWKLCDNIPEEERLISFCRFPFIYNVPTKREILYYGSFVVQEDLKCKASLEWLVNWGLRNSDLPERPTFTLKVRRHFLLEDTWHKLSILEDTYLKKQLLVQFENEMSSYGGTGYLVEFFSEVFEKVVQPEYGMFMYPKPTSPMWFPPKPSVEKNKYFLFGILCGLSIANQITAYLPFPLAVFKKLLNKKPTLSDVKELSPVLGRSLQTVLECELDDLEDRFQLCYSISWDSMDVDLIENGISTAVNNANKKDFVDKYVDYIFNKSVDDVFSEFRRGFYKVLDEQLVGIFEPEQLMEVAIGNANYDWDMYERNAEYRDIYSSTHPTIKMFWEVFHELSLEDKKRFLVFVVGNDRIPVKGMKFWKITISPCVLTSEDHMPEARTCWHHLLLPIYSTKQKLEEKLLQAISSNRGFGRFAPRV
ncbi:probable E3 ubiquitin-protein ligase HERC6 isoform X2 [Pantherophis guttatus]|uniref:Probable E3 ubiquitin-protein ligase HERC6 isoform X2 n=1 Tax=Pantherophis guttatus TaxID=94885 RepID=A0A6P9DKS2_PANGU|nr:probable E3 ubiquitin-protein ligase HERC6 isoform X2 [Pantherophis guttatus]